jgi:hypothetical protein
MNKVSYFLSIICLVYLATGCCRGGDEADKFSGSSLGFIIEDAATGKNIYSIPSLYPQYHPDSVKVSGYPSLYFNKVREADVYGFVIRNYYDPAVDGPGEQTRTFYLYLNAADTDTLQLTFTPVAGKCADTFENIQIIYNGTPSQTPANPLSVNLGVNLIKKL